MSDPVNMTHMLESTPSRSVCTRHEWGLKVGSAIATVKLPALRGWSSPVRRQQRTAVGGISSSSGTWVDRNGGVWLAEGRLSPEQQRESDDFKSKLTWWSVIVLSSLLNPSDLMQQHCFVFLLFFWGGLYQSFLAHLPANAGWVHLFTYRKQKV